MLSEYESKILKLWNQGYSTSMIAAQLGKTKNIICGKVYRMRASGIDLKPRAIVTKVRTETGEHKVAQRKSTIEKPLLGLIFKKKTEERPRPVVVVKDVPSSKPKNIKFKNLVNSSCRFVVNDGRPEDFIFCGAPKERGPYCMAHATICYQPPRLPVKKPHNPNAPQRRYI